MVPGDKPKLFEFEVKLFSAYIEDYFNDTPDSTSFNL